MDAANGVKAECLTGLNILLGEPLLRAGGAVRAVDETNRVFPGYSYSVGFIDEIGTDRPEELRRLFHIDLPEGRCSLRRRLETLLYAAASLARFEKEFPVDINDPEHGSLGVSPQLPILGI